MKALLRNQIRENILKMAEAGQRLDGRKFDAFRDVKVELNPIEKADGSAKVTVGKSTVIAGVIVGTGTPYPDTPDKGALSVNSEFLPLADPTFESGRPSDESIELSRVVDRGVRESKAIDMEKLVIEKGKHVHMVFIDLWVLDSDGNLIDAAGIAAIAALLNTKYRKVKIVDDAVELQKDRIPLPVAEQPVPVTTVKIGNSLFVDAIGEEEDAMDARITITTRKDGAICAMQKGEEGVFTQAEIETAIQSSIKNGKDIRKLLK